MDMTTQHLVDAAKDFVGPAGGAGLVSVGSGRATTLRAAIRNVEDASEQPPEIIPEGDYTVEVASSVTVALRITKGANRGRLLFAPAVILAPHPFGIKLSIERVGEDMERNHAKPSEGGFEFDDRKPDAGPWR